MNLNNQPTLDKAVVDGIEYRLVEQTDLCAGCVAKADLQLCTKLPNSCVYRDAIWLKIA